ncbi:MAG TPA: dTDP-4-dehydrorhamnose reductase [Bacteroidales bacterium]|nr:dTDP-4-dehydrorhamnose reductase [Bacteroidales bacterium]
MKILITGSKGQLGNELRVLSADYPQHQYFFCDIEELDVCNEAAVLSFIKEYQIELIINGAAYTAVDKAEQDRDAAFKLNAGAVENLCKAALANKTYLVHISTDYVFDGTKKSPYTEADAVNPVSVYGSSKLRGEEMIYKYALPSLIIRTSWLYSSFGNNFVKTILRLANEKPELRIIADQHGSPTYARDLAKAILDIISFHPLPGNPELYLFSNLGETTWYEFAKVITELSAINIPVIPIETKDYPTAATRPQNSIFSKDKIIRDFHLQIPEWKDSLKECLALLNKNN